MDRPITPRWAWLTLIGIVIAYVALAGAYAIRTPAWQAPDEPAHYNYIAQVSANGCCPVIEMGDWDQAYLSQLTSARFAPDLLTNLPTVQYEDHQPPLYYLLGSVIFRLTNGSLIALRLMSAAFGLIGVVLAFLTARVMFPDRPLIPLAAAALYAFVPQHLAILGSVSNDALAGVVIGTGLYAVMRYVRSDTLPAWLLGVIAGVGVLTKASTLMLGIIMPAAIALRWLITRRGGMYPSRLADTGKAGGIHAAFTELLREWVLFAIPALILLGIWAVRNISVYGFPDVFGLGAHDVVVADQMRTAQAINDLGWGGYVSRFVQVTFDSFWGQFGWMALPPPAWMTLVITIGLAIIGAGLIIGLTRRVAGADRLDRRAMWAILWLAIGLGAAQYLYYNLEFYQLQGRYLFTILIPFGIWFGWGLDSLGRLIARDDVHPLRLIALTPLVLLIPLNVYLVWRVIPLLAP